MAKYIGGMRQQLIGSQLITSQNGWRLDTDINWPEQNKMLRDLRWKQRGQPIKNEWWSI